MNDTHVTRAVKSVVKTAICDFYQVVLNARSLGQFRRVDEISRAELACPGLLARVSINRDDAGCFHKGRSGDDTKTDGATAKYGDGGVGCQGIPRVNFTVLFLCSGETY